MKSIKIFFLTVSTILLSCNTEHKNSETELSTNEKLITEKKADETSTIEDSIIEETSIKEDSIIKIKGNYNGDEFYEYAYVIYPRNNGCECIDTMCISFIAFSDPKIPPIDKISADLGGYLENVGDLNDDGKDELLFMKYWCTSNWRTVELWTLKNNKWIHAIEPFEIKLDHFEEILNRNEKLVTKNLNKKGYVTVKYSSMNVENLGEFVTKSVRIK